MQSLLEGSLYGKVKSFDNGSFWEMIKEGDKLVSHERLHKPLIVRVCDCITSISVRP